MNTIDTTVVKETAKETLMDQTTGRPSFLRGSGKFGGRACPIVLLCLAAAVSSMGQTYTVLTSFSGPNGLSPKAPLVQGTDGSFYGTTYGGGAHNLGTIFRMTPAGSLTTLYSFGTTSTDGANPLGGLVQGTDGNFYGTASKGGEYDEGTVFKVTPSGALTTLYSFSDATPDGATPEAGLVQGADGNFYGTTDNGGPNNGGIIFKITPDGTLTTLYSPPIDDAGLVSGLIQATDGNLYGTTSSGGSRGLGTIFKITPGGAFTTLYSFGLGNFDGVNPVAALVQGSDGNFYGTTTSDPTNAGGTIFEITPAGKFTTLYDFGLPGNVGGVLVAGLVQAANGNFYGTTATGCGTIFEVTPQGVLTTVHGFCSTSSDGNDPVAGLINGSDGNLYGTTTQGGSSGNAGTIFRLDVPVTPPPPTPSPVITSVQNAFGNSSTIAPNTWVVIKGTGLSPAGDSRMWLASDFTGTQMPTALDGVSVTMNGESVYMYYISPTQLNLLTPPDLSPGPVQVQVTANGQTSASFAVQAQALSPSFFVFDGTHVVASHLNGSIVGPPTLYPGSSTPAQPGEWVVLYANGFGAVSSPVVKGSEYQSGSLPVMPVIQIGGVSATVQFAGLVSPGLYQFNVSVPMSAANGDNSLAAQYNGQTTQTGVVLTVQSNNPPGVQSLTLSAPSVAAGGRVQGTVTFSAAAPSGGIVVLLSSSSTAVSVPSTVTIPAGATSATFTISGGSVSSATSGVITASYQGSSAQATLSVTPVGQGT